MNVVPEFVEEPGVRVPILMHGQIDRAFELAARLADDADQRMVLVEGALQHVDHARLRQGEQAVLGVGVVEAGEVADPVGVLGDGIVSPRDCPPASKAPLLAASIIPGPPPVKTEYFNSFAIFCPRDSASL